MSATDCSQRAWQLKVLFVRVPAKSGDKQTPFCLNNFQEQTKHRFGYTSIHALMKQVH